MRESRTYGFVRGAPSNRCPYRDPYIPAALREQLGPLRDGELTSDTFQALLAYREQHAVEPALKQGEGCWILWISSPKLLPHLQAYRLTLSPESAAEAHHK